MLGKIVVNFGHSQKRKNNAVYTMQEVGQIFLLGLRVLRVNRI